MANSQGIRAGRAFVELFANDRRLVRGLKAASAKLKSWGASVTAMGTKIFAIGAGVLAPLLGAVKQLMSAGDALDKMSSRVGASVEFLSALSHAAQIGGTDISAMEVGIRRLQRTAYDAARGLSTATEAFADLGIEVRGADGQLKNTEQLFMESAAALSRMENNTKKAALATVIFGRAGTQLLPMLKDGSDGLVAVMEEAQKLGIVMSGEDATAAAELTDAWTRLTSVLKMAAIRIGAALAPTLTELAERITKTVRPVIDWIKRNGQLIVSVMKIAAIVAGVGAGLIALGGIIFGLGTVFSALAGIVSAVGTGLGVIASVLGAILSPVGLVIAAIVSLGGYLLYVSGAGQKALSWLGKQFSALKDTALAAWKGISDALVAGDFSLAARILWLTLKMEWQRGVAWLTEKWIGFKEAFMTVATEAVYGTAKTLTTAWAGMQAAWVQTVAAMSQAWTVFTSSLVTGWRTAQNWISKKFVSLMAMFDDSVDVEGAQQILDEDFRREQRQRERETKAKLADIETTRQSKLAAIGQEEMDTNAALEQEKNARHAARQKQYDADVKAAESAVEQAKKEWQESLDEAAAKRAAIADETGPSPLEGIKDLEGLDFEELGKGAASVQGTFNAMAVQGLAGGDPIQRVAKASEDTARNTKRLLQEAQHGGLVFG